MRAPRNCGPGAAAPLAPPLMRPWSELGLTTGSFNESNQRYLAAHFHYLQQLLPNSIRPTCKFRAFYVYRQIPLLARACYTMLP